MAPRKIRLQAYLINSGGYRTEIERNSQKMNIKSFRQNVDSCILRFYHAAPTISHIKRIRWETEDEYVSLVGKVFSAHHTTCLKDRTSQI